MSTQKSAAIKQVNWPQHIVPVDAERKVIGAVLYKKELFYIAEKMLSPEDFSDAKCANCYECFKWLQKLNRSIDIVNATARLNAKTKQNDWAVYLSDLMTDEAVSVVNETQIEQWCNIIGTASKTRKLVLAMRESTAKMFEGESLQTASLIVSDSLFEVQNSKTERVHKESLAVAKETISLIEKIKTRGESGSPFRTHIEAVDGLIDEFTPGELIVVAARPSLGKTAIAMQSGFMIAEHGKKVGIISIEMPNNDIMLRRVSQKTGIPLHVIRGRHKLSPQQMGRITQALGDLAELPIVYDDNTYPNMELLKAKMEFLVSRYGCEILIVDYLQLIGTSNAKKSKNEYVGDNSAAFKNFAKQHSIPIVLLSQLNREVDKRPDRRPQVADLRDSGSIEQDADKVILIHRPGWYKDIKLKTLDFHGTKYDITNHAEIIVAKNRNGPTGSVIVGFKSQTVTFHDTEDQKNEDEPF